MSRNLPSLNDETESAYGPTSGQQPCLRGNRSLRVLAALGLVLITALGGVPPHEVSPSERVAAMSAADRAKVKRNFETYRKLDRSQRTRYQELHEALRTDPELKQVFDAYIEWLRSLSPWQCDELRQRSDPEERMQLVKQYWDEQHRTVDKQEALFPTAGTLAKFLARPTSEDVKRMMKVIEDSLTIPPQLRSAFDAMSDAERYLSILELAVRQREDPRRQPRAEWPDQTMIDKMIDAIADPQVRQVLHRRLTAEQRRRAVMAFCLQGFANEWKAERKRQAPGDDVIRDFFLQLEGAERDEIMQLPPIEARRRLEDKYFGTHQRHLMEMEYRIGRLRNRLGLSAFSQSGRLQPKAGDGRHLQDRDARPFLPGRKRSGQDRFFPGRPAASPRPEPPATDDNKPR